MTRGERALRTFVAIGGSAAGLIGGHLLDYRLAVPEAHRAAVLHESGHAYLPYAVVASVCLAVLAALAAGRLGYLRGKGRGGATLGQRDLAARLAVLQLVSFLALESGERLAVGQSVGDLAGPLLWLGLALQIGAALVVSGLLGLIRRAGEQVGLLLSRRDRPRGSPRVWVSIPREAGAIRHPFLNVRPARGPPRIRFAIP